MIDDSGDTGYFLAPVVADNVKSNMDLSSVSVQPVQKSNHLVISDLWRIFQPPNELMWFSTPSKNIMQKNVKMGIFQEGWTRNKYVKPPSILGNVAALAN